MECSENLIAIKPTASQHGATAAEHDNNANTTAEDSGVLDLDDLGVAGSTHQVAASYLRKKLLQVHEQLDGTAVRTGAGPSKREGTLVHQDKALLVMCNGVRMSLDSFTSLSRTKDRVAREVTVVTSTGQKFTVKTHREAFDPVRVPR